MNILLAHKFFHITGGAEVFFFECARVLEQSGHEVSFFSTKSKLNRPTTDEQYFVDAPEYTGGSFLSRTSQIGRMIYSKDAKEKFSRLLADKKPDLVHVFAIHVHLTPSILVAAHEAGIPVVMSCNDYKHICPNYKLYHHGHICTDCMGSRFYKAAVNRCCKDSTVYSVASAIEAYVHNAMDIYEKYVHTFLFASEFMARETERFWKRSFRWKMLRNPFDSQKFPLSAESEDYGLFFGRLVEEKGVDVLVRAAARAPGVKLKIVGDGPESDRLLKLAADLGLSNVEFVGPQWGEDLTRLLQKCRFVVVPSVWHENFPYVINQSFAFGKPVIGSDRGGIPEMVADGVRGLVYAADSPEALAGAMLKLCESPELAESMGREAKRFSDEAFNDRSFYESLVNIYQEVLNERASAGR